MFRCHVVPISWGLAYKGVVWCCGRLVSQIHGGYPTSVLYLLTALILPLFGFVFRVVFDVDTFLSGTFLAIFRCNEQNFGFYKGNCKNHADEEKLVCVVRTVEFDDMVFLAN